MIVVSVLMVICSGNTNVHAGATGDEISSKHENESALPRAATDLFDGTQSFILGGAK